MPEVALLIAVLLAVYLLAGIWFSSRRVRKYSRLAHVEMTRSAWAEARSRLLDLVKDRQLDPRSRTFRTLYRVQTFVLRRPDAYDEIAAQLRESLLAGQPEQVTDWLKEQRSWPKELNDVFGKMVAGTGLLIFGYPGWGRVFHVAKLLGRILMPALASTARHWALVLIKKCGASLRALRVESDLLDARAQMKMLAEAKRDSGAWRLQHAGP